MSELECKALVALVFLANLLSACVAPTTYNIIVAVLWSVLVGGATLLTCQRSPQ